MVIAILGILAGIALPRYNDYVRKAEMVHVISAMEEFKKEALFYYSRHSRWPTSNDQIDKGDRNSYANERMDNLYVRSYHGNGMVYSHIKEPVFGLSSTGWVRMRMIDDGTKINTDCTAADGQWPTTPELREYIKC